MFVADRNTWFLHPDTEFSYLSKAETKHHSAHIFPFEKALTVL